MDQYRLKKYISENPDAKLRDLVTKLLYDDIVELRITPGSKLNVNQIAASLGISRTPVAEAIGKLAEVGFVISRPGQSGNFVLDLSLPDMINLYRVRSAIECEAAALCAHSADDATVRELSMLADAFKDSVLQRDIRGMKDTDMPFHKMIIDACGNPYIIQSYNILLPKLTMYQSSMLEFIGAAAMRRTPGCPALSTTTRRSFPRYGCVCRSWRASQWPTMWTRASASRRFPATAPTRSPSCVRRNKE